MTNDYLIGAGRLKSTRGQIQDNYARILIDKEAREKQLSDEEKVIVQAAIERNPDLAQEEEINVGLLKILGVDR